MVTVTLTLRPDGQLDISGPTENRLVFLGMLELARDAVNQHHHEATAQQRVVPITQFKGAPR